jgi:hypothetical protein
MPDSPIRTLRGAGGPKSLRFVHFEQRQEADGTFVVEAAGLGIKGTGRSPELALEAAQRAQEAVVTQDSMAGKGFRQVTAEQLGIERP